MIAVGSMVLGVSGVTALRRASDVLDNGLKRKPTGQLLSFIADTASDIDRDGYGVLGRPRDPAPFDGRVHPYAADIPGNGIDENGVGGDLPLGPEPAGVEPRPNAWRQRPDVVLIVLESVRGDLVGATHHGSPITPVINALAASGISSERAFSHNGYTAQSRNHLFSGSLSAVPRATSLLDDFKAHGYEVAYFSAQDESFGGPELSVAFRQAHVAFDARQDVEHRYTTFTTPGSLGLPFDVLNGHVKRFLESRTREQPLFLYVNFYDAHFPYHHRGIQPLISREQVGQPAIGPARADAVRAMYLNTVANVDRAVGDLLGNVRRTLGREPAVIVLADHGESLFDEGFLGHGYALNDVQTRIPFVAYNIGVSIEEPFGQSEIRRVIGSALETSGSTVPAVRQNPDKNVFQYLGVIERPAQIGFVRLSGRVVYDFRSNRVRFGGPWRRPADLQGTEAQQFLALVRTWERMVLARLTAAASTD
jgi:hypothetical protein